MLKSRSFAKVTKAGNILKIVKEHYLRDDIGCGSLLCEKCKEDEKNLETGGNSTKLFSGPHYVLPDTNVFLHQIDVMENKYFKNVIVLQTVLDEVKNSSLPIYERLRKIIQDKPRHFYVFSNEHHRETYIEKEKDETVNERNERAIRVSASWYKNHLQPYGIEIVLITENEITLKKSQDSKILSSTLIHYIEGVENQPELIDIVSKPTELKEGFSQRKSEYEDHLPENQIEVGLKSKRFIKGRFTISSHNYFEASILTDSYPKPILIKGLKDMNRAIQGDVVAVELFPQNEWKKPSIRVVDDDSMFVNDEDINPEELEDEDAEIQPTGKVVGIVKRNLRQYCGSIDPSLTPPEFKNESVQSVLFIPLDKTVPKIIISTHNIEGLENLRILVAIDTWERNSKFPSGHYIRKIGPIGDKNTETEVILLENGVPYEPFNEAILSELPDPGWKVKDQKFDEKRENLRHLDVCSVDPPGCTDIDDALHARLLDNGNYEVGVHIADVSSFVRPNTAMDKEAQKRGTTVYLVNRRIDMLPELLGSNLCSLRSNVDRFTFSCIWVFNKDYEIIDTRFTKSIIHSKASFTYDQAQERLDAPEKFPGNITSSLHILNKLAKVLKQRRLDKGALLLSSPEVRFRLENESNDPVDVEMKEMKEANSMVEEFMLLANVSVAKKIYNTFPQCSLLRRHQDPPKANFEAFSKALSSRGLNIDFSSNKSLAESLENANVADDPFLNKLIRMLATRCMMQALYVVSGSLTESEFYHYGLATEIYTHFTSPIRRYADVIVHRLLAASIGADSTYPELVSKEHLERLCNNINRRHRKAQHASRDSIEWHTVKFMKGQVLEEDARVTKVLKNGFIVLVPRLGIEGIIKVPPKDKLLNSFYEFKPSENALFFSNGQIKIFDSVKVQIKVVGNETQKQKVEFLLIHPNIEGFFIQQDKDQDKDKESKKRSTQHIDKESTQTSEQQKIKQNPKKTKQK